MRLQGAGSTLWLSPVTHVLTALALDPTATDHPFQSVLLTTSQSFEAQLDAPTTATAIAAAGPDRVVPQGQPVTLNGYFSGGDTHRWVSSFAWTFVMRAPGSQATLSDASAPSPTFTPDQPGEYLLSLVTTDGTNPSQDSMRIAVPLANGFVAPDNPALTPCLRPDISVPVNTTVTVSAAFSTWQPPALSIDCTIVITNPSGSSTMPVTGDSTLSTSLTTSQPGFYIASESAALPRWPARARSPPACCCAF